jgi:hypothetical protein
METHNSISKHDLQEKGDHCCNSCKEICLVPHSGRDILQSLELVLIFNRDFALIHILLSSFCKTNSAFLFSLEEADEGRKECGSHRETIEAIDLTRVKPRTKSQGERHENNSHVSAFGNSALSNIFFHIFDWLKLEIFLLWKMVLF